MFVKFTYVDSSTKLPVSLDQRYTQLTYPEGVTFSWAAESQYPTNNPEFYGEAVVGTVPGILKVLTKEEFDSLYAQELVARRWKKIPRTVTVRQAKLALLEQGLYEGVSAYIASVEGEEGLKLKINWDHASVFDREDPLVLMIGSVLGWSDEQLDALFVKAAGL